MKTTTFLKFIIQLLIFLIVIPVNSIAQDQTVARKWMDVILFVVANDGQGPTIQSRNLFHATVAMYDAWAVYDDTAKTYLLGNTPGNYTSKFDPDFKPSSANLDSLRAITINYAVYKMISGRYREYSSKNRTIERVDSLFIALGGKRFENSMEYMNGPEELGNYIASIIVEFGFQDGSHEDDLYESYGYQAANPPLYPEEPGNPGLKNANRWQPIEVRDYILDKGEDPTLEVWNNLIIAVQTDFVTPEWGDVTPFAMTGKDLSILSGEGNNYNVYVDPGPPPYIENQKESTSSEYYKWGFLLNTLWSGHMDPADSVKWDISPGVIGNTEKIPNNYRDYAAYFNLMEGGVQTKGHKINPATQKPYEPNVVLRGDYTRVIAEYWVDGINTASPPGHWLNMLKSVTDHPEFERKWEGRGPVLDTLQWDIKAYFAMMGAMHDAAIAAWSVKGYYDYIRPISAIRYMAGKGQSSDESLPNYHSLGIPLVEGKVEIVGKKDPLAGKNKENVGKVKVYCWRGPDAIEDVHTDHAGVGWVLAENWWPYQRYSFVTPAFAGYVSGHSTFSSAGAEVMTLLTGDSFFPGGLGEFTAGKNQFLQFEEGPSQDVTLQWATYYDAANETCLSRIWMASSMSPTMSFNWP